MPLSKATEQSLYGTLRKLLLNLQASHLHQQAVEESPSRQSGRGSTEQAFGSNDSSNLNCGLIPHDKCGAAIKSVPESVVTTASTHVKIDQLAPDVGKRHVDGDLATVPTFVSFSKVYRWGQLALIQSALKACAQQLEMLI